MVKTKRERVMEGVEGGSNWKGWERRKLWQSRGNNSEMGLGWKLKTKCTRGKKGKLKKKRRVSLGLGEGGIWGPVEVLGEGGNAEGS